MEGLLKAKNIRVPAKATVWYVGTSVITKGIGLLVTPIFTRVLSGEEYGSYSLYMSYLGLFSLICTAGFSAGVIYKGFQRFREKKDEFLAATLGFNLCFCLGICILLFTFSSFWGIAPACLLILCLQLIADTTVGVSLMEKRYYYSYRTVALVGIFESLGAPLISLTLLYGTRLGFVAKLWGLLIPAILAAAPLAFGIIGKGRKLFDKEIWGYLFRSALPLFPSILSSALSSNIASFIFANTVGSGALAKYSVTHTVGIGLLFVVGTLGSSLAPWITRKLSLGNSLFVREVVGLIFTLLCGATLFLIAAAPEVVAFLAPREYSEAVAAALPIALATIPSFITSVSGVGLVFSERGGGVSLASVIGALSNLALSALLIPPLKYIGAGAALLLSNLISAAASIYFLKRSGGGDILPLFRLFPVFLLTSLFGLLITLLYDYALPRFLLLIFPAVMILRALPTLKSLIREK